MPRFALLEAVIQRRGGYAVLGEWGLSIHLKMRPDLERVAAKRFERHPIRMLRKIGRAVSTAGSVALAGALLLGFQNCVGGKLGRPDGGSVTSLASTSLPSSAPAPTRPAPRISSYVTVPVDQYVGAKGTTILQTQIRAFVDRTTVFIQADGRVFTSGTPLAMVRILVDGVAVGNAAVVDWQGSVAAVQHNYEVIATATLSAGEHLVTLSAENAGANLADGFYVGAGSNLAVLQSTAKRIQTSSLPQDVGPFAWNSPGDRHPFSIATQISDPDFGGLSMPQPGDLPCDGSSCEVPKNHVAMFPVFSLPAPIATRAALLFAGRAYLPDAVEWHDPATQRPIAPYETSDVSKVTVGDAMVGISLDGSCPNQGLGTWSVNDLNRAAELQAPVFSHAMYPGGPPTTPFVFASSFPWGIQRVVDPVRFNVGADSAFVSVEDPAILGAGYADKIAKYPLKRACKSGPDIYFDTCFATNDVSTFKGCSAVESKVPIARATVTLRSSDDGIVMFTAKTRVQTGGNGSFRALMGISIDGVDRGFVGVQEFKAPSTISQRTITASYLADQTHPLTPGTHQVIVWIQGFGPAAETAWANSEMTLLYFD